VTYYNLGKIYAQQKNYAKAESFYNKALALKSDFPPLFNDMAALFDKEERPRLVYRYLAKALELSPHDFFAAFNMGFYYLQHGQPAKAITYLSTLPGNEKSFGERLPFYLGIAYEQTGRLGRAAVYFKKAINKNPKNIKAYIHLAEVFCAAGKREWARREMATAIDLIGNQELFERIVKDMTGNSGSIHLQPKKEIIIPLMREILVKKSTTLEKWSEELPMR
jgi:tetratricopeptide (TPR) repeat protein